MVAKSPWRSCVSSLPEGKTNLSIVVQKSVRTENYLELFLQICFPISIKAVFQNCQQRHQKNQLDKVFTNTSSLEQVWNKMILPTSVIAAGRFKMRGLRGHHEFASDPLL